MKKCSQCKEEKDEDNFFRNAKRGYFPYCKACAKKRYAKTHYENNKSLYKIRSKQSSSKNRKKFIEFKSTLTCSVCEESRHWCIDFHHINPAEKTATVSQIVAENSFKKLNQELEKCIPLCKNCHADLHYRERQSYTHVE